MKVAIVISAPPLRQVFRGEDVRAVAIVAEKALWPLVESGTSVSVTVQCGGARQQARLNDYFRDIIAEQKALAAFEARSRESGRNAPGAQVG